jgi:energy-coupling factor transporter ATP-binding protein EcfA2
MYTRYAPSKKSVYGILLLSLGILLLGSCNRAHHLGMEDNPQEILNTKLNNPQAELTPNQSISLVNYCATLGEQNAAPAANKEVLMVLGNTGTGKSTAVNYLLGCEMKSALDEFGEEIIVVAPESIRPEVMPIGHGDQSHTFMPQIVPDPDNNDQTYCDCPGFSDNRGAEINIANAINTRRVLQQARGVKAVFLASYSGLSNDRGASRRAMESMCLQMFGSADNLRRHQNSVLLGITKAPLYNRSGQPISLNAIRSRIIQANTPISQILANRVFLFDPLDRGSDNPDFWSRERCRTAIAQLSSIPQREAETLFQTVLTGDDQTKLKHIMRAQAASLVASLECDDYQAAGRHWQSLTRLRVIGHAEVENMVGEHALSRVRQHVLGCVGAFREYAAQYEFDQAERQLALLRMLISHFPNTDLQVSVVELESLLAQYKEKKTEALRNTDIKLAAAKQEAVLKVQEEMGQKLEQLKAQLAEAQTRSNQSEQNITISINVQL